MAIANAGRPIAALYVETGGTYFGLSNVDPWDSARDARTYAGRLPVVAHPPCNRWGQLAAVNEVRYGLKVGDDAGCFAAALAAVRRCGGVLEHPAYSFAWGAFSLPRPSNGCWRQGLFDRGWSTQVAQRNYGHRARKLTWLYYVGDNPPALDWSKPAPSSVWVCSDRPRAQMADLGISFLSKKEAKATPAAFRDLLIKMARKSRGK